MPSLIWNRSPRFSYATLSAWQSKHTLASWAFSKPIFFAIQKDSSLSRMLYALRWRSNRLHTTYSFCKTDADDRGRTEPWHTLEAQVATPRCASSACCGNISACTTQVSNTLVISNVYTTKLGLIILVSLARLQVALLQAERHLTQTTACHLRLDTSYAYPIRTKGPTRPD